MRIGSSQPAPLFKVVASPNEYSEGATGPAARSETRTMYLAFWNDFKEYAQQQGTILKLWKPTTRPLAYNRSRPEPFLNFTDDQWILQTDRVRGVHRWTERKVGLPEAAPAEKEEIEKTTGSLEWMELPEAQACRVVRYRKEVDPLDKSVWPDLFQWLKEKAEQFHNAFSGRIRALPIEDAMAAAAGEES